MNDQTQSSPYRAPAFADARPELAAPGATPERLAHLQEHGFVIINDFVGNPWIPILREAGRRVTEACSAGERLQQDRQLEGVRAPRPGGGAVGDPGPRPSRLRGAGLCRSSTARPSFLGFVESWCNGLGPEDMVSGGMLLWCNPRGYENQLGWHRDVTWWGTGKSYLAQREVRGDTPEDYSEEVERIRWEEIRANNASSIEERDGVSMFLALDRRRVPRARSREPRPVADAARARRPPADRG